MKPASIIVFRPALAAERFLGGRAAGSPCPPAPVEVKRAAESAAFRWRSALEAERFLCRLATGSPQREALGEVKRGAKSAASP
jgi:hypothetical protein